MDYTITMQETAQVGQHSIRVPREGRSSVNPNRMPPRACVHCCVHCCAADTRMADTRMAACTGERGSPPNVRGGIVPIVYVADMDYRRAATAPNHLEEGAVLEHVQQHPQVVVLAEPRRPAEHPDGGGPDRLQDELSTN